MFNRSLSLLTFFFAFPAAPASGMSVEALNVQYMNDVKQFFNENLTDCQILETPLAIENITPPSTLSIYPNPTSENLNITVSEAFIGETYSIFNNVGQLVLTNKIQSTQTTIDVSNLAQGTYALVLKGARTLVVLN